jgi:hypothetical protein
MRGFVASIGASLEEFAGDVREISVPMIKNLLSLKPSLL